MALSWKMPAVSAALGAGALLGVAIGRLFAVDPAADWELASVLRAVAVMQSLVVVLVAGATMWRVGRVVSPRLLTMYVASAALLAASPGLVFQGALVAVGAVLFHLGLSLFAAALALDDGEWFRVKRGGRARHRA